MKGKELRVLPKRIGHWLLAPLGFGLAVAGVVAYVVRFSFQRLEAPWYMPALALLGVLLVSVSLIEKRTIWRGLALVALLLLAGLEIAFLNAMRLPAYAGPVAAGRPFPAFEAKRADGSLLTQGDLLGEQGNLLVFFRGRW
jgi:hypothetical protein